MPAASLRGVNTTADTPTTGRIVLLTTSPRVAPGLLSWPAWELLHAADLVVCADPGHPHLPYLRQAGVTVEVGEVDAGALVTRCAEGATVVVVAGDEGEPRLAGELARLAAAGRTPVPELELLSGSYDPPGARLLDLVRVMDRIRAECPWTGPRTSEQLVKYALEEAYELVEAIETGDRAAFREELGDVLLQVVFHARIAEDHPTDPFTIDDVAAGIVDKLVHRHPHVFGDATAETAEDVKAHWLRTKAEEKQRASVTDGVPLGQPALALAAKLVGRARTAGLEVPLPPADRGVGEALLRLAAEAEEAGVDPESALRTAARAYRDAIRRAERARRADRRG